MVAKMFGRWLTNTEDQNSQKTRQSTGAIIENQARLWLQQQGLVTIECNYHCRTGEIDIVMTDGQQLVFVEVRYRRQNSFGSAAETVNGHKQKKLLKAATHYLLQHPRYSLASCRFDVLAAQPGDKDAKLRWIWIQDAFTG
jgi:putative endonuclease